MMGYDLKCFFFLVLLYAAVPSQTPNLAATLQAAAQGVTVSSSQPVRLNPMMVTVDPTRHANLAVHAPYTPSSEGNK